MGFLLLLALATQDVESSIRDLGSDDPAVRERATEQLVAAGGRAEPALRRALESKDPEIVARARAALGLIERARRAEAIRPRLPKILLIMAPDVLDMLAEGSEASLIQLAVKLSGIKGDGEYLGTATIDRQLTGSVFQIMWERIQESRKAGAPMLEFEDLYFHAVMLYSVEPDSASHIPAPVPPRQIITMCLDPAWSEKATRFTESVVRNFFHEYPPFDAKDLTAALLEHPNPMVQRYGIGVAGLTGDRAVIPKIRELLEEGDNETAIDAAIALGRLGATVNVSKILELVDARPEFQWRSQALLISLLESEPYAEIPAFLEVFQRQPSDRAGYLFSWLMGLRGEQIADFVADAFPKPGWANSEHVLWNALRHLRSPKLDRVVQHMVEKPPPASSSMLAKALSTTGRLDLLPLLLANAPGDEKADVVLHMALERLPGSDALILEGVKGKDPKFLSAAGAGRISAAAPDLVRLAEDKDPKIADAALRALAGLSTDHYERNLDSWISKPSLHPALVETAGSRRARIPVEIILPLLRDEEGTLRLEIVESFVAVHPDRARPILEAAWKQTSMVDRWTAATCFEKIDPAAATQWMRELAVASLPEPDRWYRSEAIDWLAKRGDPEVFDCINLYPNIRTDRADALVRKGDRQAAVWLYATIFSNAWAPFALNALAMPELWKRYETMPLPTGCPRRASVGELAAWLNARGVPVRFHPDVLPEFRGDRIDADAKSVLELLEWIHNTSRGSCVRFEPDGTAVIQTNLTARRAWMDWWERRNP